MGVTAAVIGGAAALAGTGAQIGFASSQGDGPSATRTHRRLTRQQIGLIPEVYNALYSWGPHFTRSHSRLTDIGAARASRTIGRLAPVARAISDREQEGRLAGEFELLRRYAPQARQGMEAYSPRSAAILGQLQAQAEDELANPYALSSGVRRELEQASFGDSSLRGFGRSPMDAFAAYASLGRASEQRARERRGFAADVIGLDRGLYGDPYSMIASRFAAPTPRISPMDLYAAGATAVQLPQVNPNSGYEAAALQTQAASQLARNQAISSGIGAGVGAAGNIYGAYLGTRTPNPYYGMAPGDVPYTYRGDPSSRYM